jgi:RNA polymerase sigma factor (sigma-70 family)
MSASPNHNCVRAELPDLLSAAQAGDEGAFCRLIERYRHGVYAFCVDRTGNFGVAEDLTQETVLKARAQLHALRAAAAFPAWLRRIALNCCRAWQRRTWPDTVSTDPADCPQLTQDVFAEALRREAAREVRAALWRIPENNRIALIMHYLRGDSYREIAEFLGVPETTVVGRLHRARGQMRSLLEARIRDHLTGLAD